MTTLSTICNVLELVVARLVVPSTLDVLKAAEDLLLLNKFDLLKPFRRRSTLALAIAVFFVVLLTVLTKWFPVVLVHGHGMLVIESAKRPLIPWNGRVSFCNGAVSCRVGNLDLQQPINVRLWNSFAGFYVWPIVNIDKDRKDVIVTIALWPAWIFLLVCLVLSARSNVRLPNSCVRCGYPIEKSFLACPECGKTNALA